MYQKHMRGSGYYTLPPLNKFRPSNLIYHVTNYKPQSHTLVQFCYKCSINSSIRTIHRLIRHLSQLFKCSQHNKHVIVLSNQSFRCLSQVCRNKNIRSIHSFHKIVCRMRRDYKSPLQNVQGINPKQAGFIITIFSCQ